MRSARLVLSLVTLGSLLVSEEARCQEEDVVSQFEVTFEWKPTPTLTLSRVPVLDKFLLTIDVASLKSARLPLLLKELSQVEGTELAGVKVDLKSELADHVSVSIALKPLGRDAVGSALADLVSILDVAQITMDANVFDGVREGERRTLAMELVRPRRENEESAPDRTEWTIELRGFHYYRPAK